MNIFKKKQKQYILGTELVIDIKDIKISDEFKNSPPCPEKLKRKYESYLYGKNLSDIIINQDGELIDGFCTFLIAKMFDYKKVMVKIRIV